MRRIAGSATISAFLAVCAACSGGAGPSTAIEPTGSSSDAPVTMLPAVATPLPEGGDVSPGTYSTKFRPEMNFVADSADWEVDVNAPGWVGMEFRLPDHVLGTLNIIAVDKVFDPENGKLIDPPDHLAQMLADLSGLKVRTAPSPVVVGGIDGEQIDVLVGSDNVQLGPIPGAPDVENGLGKRQAFRIIEILVDGQYVQITFAPDEAGAGHFADAAEIAEPLIDSITWG